MKNAKLKTAQSFTIIGLIFLAFGFVQQDFALSFESGMFNLGLIFTLGGFAGIAIDKRLQSNK
jgi:hypothetical protein